jgi:tetratricopeptide (TPR) repeat protein
MPNLRKIPLILGSAFIAAILAACATSGKAGEQLAKGLKLLDEGKTAEAIKVLEKAVDDDYSNPAAHRAYVQAMASAFKFKETEEKYAGWIQRDPRWAARYALGLVHFVKSPASAMLAVDDFKAALALGPDIVDIRYRLALVQLEMEDFRGACETLSTAVAMAPYNPSLRPAYGMCLIMTGSPAAAREQVAALANLEPSAKDMEHAQSVLAKINNPFLMLPASVETDYAKAVDLLEKYDVPAKAMEILEAITQKYPDLGPVHLMLGMAYSKIGDNGRALAELKTASEMSPDSAAVWQALAGIYQGLDKMDNAAEYYKRALALDPLSANTYIQLGAIYANKGDFEKAIPLFQSLVHLYGRRVDYHFMLARTLQSSGNLDAAEKEFQWIVDHDKDSPHGLVGLGYIYASRLARERDPVKRQALYNKAWDMATKALQQDPNFEAAKNLVDLLKSQK